VHGEIGRDGGVDPVEEAAELLGAVPGVISASTWPEATSSAA
jgi:hypothetical protein